MRKICISEEEKKDIDRLITLVDKYNQFFEQNSELNDEGVYFITIPKFSGNILNKITIGASFVYKNTTENLDKFHYKLRDLIDEINDLAEVNGIFLYEP